MGTDIEALAEAVGGRILPPASAGVPVADIAFDHRLVRPGSLFACVPGSKVDGHDLASQAVEAGAVALLTERDVAQGAPQIRVGSVRASMGALADHFFEHPSREMTLVGVTGTNGKTTTTFLLEGAFAAAGTPSGLVGTVETHMPGGVRRPAGRTTPEAFDLQRLLREMVSAGAQAGAMEVSSEGLDLLRVEGTRFACSVFTNLTQDHLNHHGTMERYFEAKSMLFRQEMTERAVICTDDDWGKRLAASVTQPLVTFGVAGDVRATDVDMGRDGSTFRARTPEGEVPVRVRLPGPFNVTNALGVVAVAVSLGWDLAVSAEGIASVAHVPGRMEPVDAGQGFTVLVDYAHTPDALEGALRAAREIARDGRVIVVFGCGGDRDRTKRPLMGKAAALNSDVTIITSDNPRSEDPASIVAQVAEGAMDTGRAYISIVDRAEAIAVAVREASEGDVVVIAGKGHETGQTFATETLPFDDRIVARRALEELSR